MCVCGVANDDIHKHTNHTVLPELVYLFHIVMLMVVSVCKQVENSDIHAHKNVLACVSPHLMELFSAEEVCRPFSHKFTLMSLHFRMGTPTSNND